LAGRGNPRLDGAHVARYSLIGRHGGEQQGGKPRAFSRLFPMQGNAFTLICDNWKEPIDTISQCKTSNGVPEA
jgi:hypothetical protein